MNPKRRNEGMTARKKAATTRRTATRPYLVISRKGRGSWKDVGWYSTWRDAEAAAKKASVGGVALAKGRRGRTEKKAEFENGYKVV